MSSLEGAECFWHSWFSKANFRGGRVYINPLLSSVYLSQCLSRLWLWQAFAGMVVEGRVGWGRKKQKKNVSRCFCWMGGWWNQWGEQHSGTQRLSLEGVEPPRSVHLPSHPSEKVALSFALLIAPLHFEGPLCRAGFLGFVCSRCSTERTWKKWVVCMFPCILHSDLFLYFWKPQFLNMTWQCPFNTILCKDLRH